MEDARTRLFQEMDGLALLDDSEFHQGDGSGGIDLFAPVTPTVRQNLAFRLIHEDEGHSSARGIIQEMMHHYRDVDGNFVEQFQSTAFDSRLWELYVFAYLNEERLWINRDHPAPDFLVAEAWAAYVKARKHKWSSRHLQDHEHISSPGGVAKKRGAGMTEPGPLASLMPLRLGDLTPARVEEWLKQETVRRPTYAALAYRLLRAFIRWAAGHVEYAGVVHVDAVGSRVAKDHVPRVKPKEGDSLQREQLAPWFKAVREIGNPVISAYLQTLLLTGARREELAGLTWADADFQWKSLTIRDKVEGERVIPLTPYVATLLSSLARRKDEKGKPLPWVFSSPIAASGRIQEPRIQHVKALQAAGLPHVTLHGLRRSFGTLAEWTEAPVGIVAQIMGHKPSALAEKHYRRRPLDLLRMWHTRIESWILTEAGIQQTQEKAAGLRLVANN